MKLEFRGNLVQACREMREWQETSLLREGVVRSEAQRIADELSLDQPMALSIVENMVAKAAMDAVIAASDAPEVG